MAQRKHIVRVAIPRGVPARQRAGEVPLLIGMFRFQNARGTGPHDDGYAVGVISLLRFRDRDHESILLQPEPGQPVIATIESFQFIPERKILQSFDSSDVGLECDIFEVAEF